MGHSGLTGYKTVDNRNGWKLPFPKLKRGGLVTGIHRSGEFASGIQKVKNTLSLFNINGISPLSFIRSFLKMLIPYRCQPPSW